jgi:hypothetical protein
MWPAIMKNNVYHNDGRMEWFDRERMERCERQRPHRRCSMVPVVRSRATKSTKKHHTPRHTIDPSPRVLGASVRGRLVMERVGTGRCIRHDRKEQRCRRPGGDRYRPAITIRTTASSPTVQWGGTECVD